MKNSYFLDTSIAISYIRGNREIISLVDNLKGSIYCSHIVSAELCEGIFRVRNPKKMENDIEDFLSGMDGMMPVNFSVAYEFGKIRAELKKSGNVIEDLDILIAATCVANNLTLVTLNKRHFEKVEGLAVISPTDQES